MAKENPDPDEIERKEAAVLSAREAMTIISPTTGSGLVPDRGTAPPEDRSEHLESDDSASSQT
jgi:hypothetical protein